MGSKSTTYSEITITNMFDEDDNLFTKDILRIFALTKRIDPIVFTKQMIQNINVFFNNKMLERFGVIIDGNLKSEEMDHEDFKRVVAEKTGINLNYLGLGVITTKDCYGVVISGETVTISEYLNYAYPYDTSHEDIITESYYYDASGGSDCRVVTVENKIYKYDIHNNGNYYKVINYGMNNDGSYTITLYNENDEEDIIDIVTPIDNRIFYLTAYGEFVLNYPVTQDDYDGYIIIPSSDVSRITINRKALLYVVKKDGQFVATGTRYKNALYHKFSLGSDFEENIMSDDKVKDVAIITSTRYNNPKFKDAIEEVYGTEYNPIDVTYQGEITIRYIWINEGDSLKLKVTYKGTKTGVESSDLEAVIIPFDYIKRKPLREKYDIIRDLYNVLLYAEVTVKKKWYQSGFFSFVFMVFTLGFGFYINPVLTAISFAATTAVSALTDNKYIKLAVQIGLVLYGGFKAYQAGKLKAFDTAFMSIKMTSDLFLVELDLKVTKTYREIEKYRRESEEYTEEIREMRKNALYSPLDLVDSYYDTIYSFQYNQLEAIDAMCRVDFTLY